MAIPRVRVALHAVAPAANPVLPQTKIVLGQYFGIGNTAVWKKMESSSHKACYLINGKEIYTPKMSRIDTVT